MNSRKKFIPEIILDYLNSKGIDFVENLPNEMLSTIEDVINYCNEKAIESNKQDFNFEKLVRESLAEGYDSRYLSFFDERSFSRSNFISVVTGIFANLGLAENYREQKTIVVGAGNGNNLESKFVYHGIKDLTLVDIAPKLLEQAKKFMPHAKIHLGGAEKLEDFPDGTFDLYISLRTYQSTYFNIPSSLLEASRVLKKDGVILISIACGYTDKNGEYVSGLYNPHTGILENERANLFITAIKQYLSELAFNIVGIEKVPTEIFIFARK